MSPIRRWGANRLAVATCALLAAAVASSTASAGFILAPGVYRLSNRNSNLAGIGFGHLTPEQLSGLSRRQDVLTFSFDHPSAEVALDIKQVSSTEYTMQISGTAWGSFIRRGGHQPLVSGPARVDLSYDLVRDSEDGDRLFMRQTSAD